ncbi:TetR/AcrR family transcriptional regulator [Pelagibacterium lentulum]|uniref:HTH tetR-type domain-containing protein n=1 Tax=Pelagibacterium lentulum TaxID=2029865 RepID=A0A916RDZ1_9HYPH|nr:TetR/AcrR family transcriptional regulator [Pelagibacterium lentulum]GGA53764.1 hypothetical protein GCM10011499_24810 [Pelagibacterium lentulum]
MEQGEDRRVRRTRAALRAALAELVVTQSYDSLTVAKICDAADVGRSAFYQHFKGKDDLLRSGFAKLEADLAAAEVEPGKSFSAGFFAHALRHRELYRALTHSQAAPIATAAVRRILESRARKLLAPESPAGVPRNLRAALLVDVLISLVRWWLDRESPQAVDKIDAMFHELVSGILGTQESTDNPC